MAGDDLTYQVRFEGEDVDNQIGYVKDVVRPRIANFEERIGVVERKFDDIDDILDIINGDER